MNYKKNIKQNFNISTIKKKSNLSKNTLNDKISNIRVNLFNLKLTHKKYFKSNIEHKNFKRLNNESIEVEYEKEIIPKDNNPKDSYFDKDMLSQNLKEDFIENKTINPNFLKKINKLENKKLLIHDKGKKKFNSNCNTFNKLFDARTSKNNESNISHMKESFDISKGLTKRKNSFDSKNETILNLYPNLIKCKC